MSVVYDAARYDAAAHHSRRRCAAIISYLAHYEQITQGKPMPGPVHDYKIAIKVRPAGF